MYSEKTRERALGLVREGLSYREVSRELGGKPGPAIIRRWADGYVPTGKRMRSMAYTMQQKLGALKRVEQGEHYRDVASDVGCAPATILTWRRLWRDGGEKALETAVDRMRQ